MWIFLGAIAVVALLGADSDLRPSFGGKPLSMVLVIQMFMLLTGALIIILTKTNPASISKNEVFRSGMIAIVAVYGIAWMAETMFGAHMSEIQGVLGEMVKEYPWAYVHCSAAGFQVCKLSGCGAGGDCSGRAGDRR